MNGAWTTRGRKAGAVLLLSFAGLAGLASNPGRRALCSARAFACYYQALGATLHPNTWDRVTLSATLAVADSAPSRQRACPAGRARP